MRFFEPVEIAHWCRKRGFTLDDTGKLLSNDELRLLDTRAFGQQANPAGQEAEVAAACVRGLGDWDECLLWVTTWGVWPSTENWPDYDTLRGAQGERRSLEKAPGHLFVAGESALLMKFVCTTLTNAWDAMLLPISGNHSNDHRVEISHDEWVYVFAKARPSFEPRIVKYRSGEDVQAGDVVLFFGQRGTVEFVVDARTVDLQNDWYMTEYGPGAMIADPIAGHTYVSDPEQDEHLQFVSRADK